MVTWLYLHGRALKHALRSLASQPLGTLLSAMVVGIALSLPAAGYVLLDNIALLARGVSGTPEISVFLEQDAAAADVKAVEERLRQDRDVASYRYVARDQALEQLARTGLGDVLTGLTVNPLPDAFVVTPKGDEAQLYDILYGRFIGWPKVAHVQLDSAWVKRLNALLELGRFAVTLLAVLLGFALVIVTFNTIRLQILTQRQEINVSRLLGATDLFIRRPFYWFGSLQGLLGGVVALGTVWLTVWALRRPVTSLAQTYGAVFTLNGPGATESLLILVFACFLGWLGSAISVRRHLVERLN